MARLFLFLVCLAAATVSTSPSSARNLALVIGNDAYQNIPGLTKAVSDARVMQSALAELGFTVVSGENATQSETAALIAEREGQIQPGDRVLFHFSGHGIALEDEDLLLPVDVPRPQPGHEEVVESSAVSAAKIIDGLRARGADAVIGVLDAFHWNPFAATGMWDIGAIRGLDRIDIPRGSFVLYSAAPGQAALDRLSENDQDPASLFIRVLANVIRQPGLSLVEIAKTTQTRVHDLAAAAGHDQVPSYDDEIIGDLVLLPAAERENTPAALTRQNPSRSRTPPADVQVAAVSPDPFPLNDPTLKSTHGSWQIRCDVPEDAEGDQEQCALMQFVTARDRDNVGLTVIFLKAPGDNRVMRVVAPSGVWLPAGLGLTIGESDLGRAGFARCLQTGCVAEVVVEPDLLSRLRSGETATFTIFQTPEHGIAIPISLNGFDQGYDALP